MTQHHSNRPHSSQPSLSILGIRGLPARHGGFETFASALAPHLHAMGWHVRVYCQTDIPQSDKHSDTWNGIDRIYIYAPGNGPLSTIIYDFRCILYDLRFTSKLLVLGYNTAIFLILSRLNRRQIFINMDGIEWKRSKWNISAKLWFRLNELLATKLAHQLIADHPEIQAHLLRAFDSDSTMIPYSAEPTSQNSDILSRLGLQDSQYGLTVARIEPENQILEIVRAYSSKPRSVKLLVLGTLSEHNSYHQSVKAAASRDVWFPGPIYESADIWTLRRGARYYIHGHTVGGTNPSLIEALASGSTIIAHNNPYNTWVADQGAIYFDSEDTLSDILSHLEVHPESQIAQLRNAAKQRYSDVFTPERVLSSYETMLSNSLADRS